MSTTKISITLDDAALAWLRKRAKLLHGGNLSAAIAETTELARKNEALTTLLDADGVPELSPSELAEVVKDWPKRRARRRPAR
ncbi:MAG: hypothetical protein KIT84_29545 [Labilithrix sp.]|nr:hypothetical protein [Labilithrix sp.]MCW5815208.1 hypothetical protein [Labilithrix sp.]